MNVNEISRNKSGALNVLLWLVQIGVAVMFIMAGSSKLMGDEQMVGLFAAIGLGQWFRYVTGLIEVLGAIFLFIPALSGVAGLLFIGVMTGAIATHLFIVGGAPTIPVVLLLASIFIVWGRIDRIKLIFNKFF